MEIRVFETKAEMAGKAAEQAASAIVGAIARRGRAHIIAATGASQFEFLDALTAAPGIDWSKTAFFHLDEYVGLPETHPASFRRYLKERIVARVQPGAFHFVDGDAPDPAAEALRVGALLAAHPIDVAFVGIGENGHLAFNDPPADFETEEPYLVVTLDEACRRQQMGEGWFQSLSEVPERAISMSIRADPEVARDPVHRPGRTQGPGRARVPRPRGEPGASGLGSSRSPADHGLSRRTGGPSPAEPGRGGGMKLQPARRRGLRARRHSARWQPSARTTHMGIVAHPDDLEIMAWPAIRDCFGQEERWFLGVVATTGAGSPRSGPYAALRDDEMAALRVREQKKAAVMGEYGAVVLLDYGSDGVKPSRTGVLVEDVTSVLRVARPSVVYTHNLADRHETHVGMALATIEACRALPEEDRPPRACSGARCGATSTG